MNNSLILVTNDDGIHSRGLAAAARAAMRVGDVVIAAPNEQQTAMGRAYSRREDLGIIDVVELNIGLEEPVQAYAVHGSPGYAAAYGIAEIAVKVKGRRPDLTTLLQLYGVEDDRRVTPMILECVSKSQEMQFRVDLTAFQGDFPQVYWR